MRVARGAGFRPSLQGRIAKVLALTSGDDFRDLLHSHVSVAPADHFGEVVAIGDPGTINAALGSSFWPLAVTHIRQGRTRSPRRPRANGTLRILTEGRKSGGYIGRDGKALRLSRGDEDEGRREHGRRHDGAETSDLDHDTTVTNDVNSKQMRFPPPWLRARDSVVL